MLSCCNAYESRPGSRNRRRSRTVIARGIRKAWRGFSEEEFEELFGTSPVYMGAIVKIPESERGKEITVTLGADDYLTINGHIEFIVRVNE